MLPVGSTIPYKKPQRRLRYSYATTHWLSSRDPEACVCRKAKAPASFSLAVHRCRHPAWLSSQHRTSSLSSRSNAKTTQTRNPSSCFLHSLTRTAAGWAHEKSMHDSWPWVERVSASFKWFYHSQHHHHSLSPGTCGRPPLVSSGNLAGLKEAGPSNSFYWIPSVANFPVIDSVLGDTDGNVYTLQATIASTHPSPEEGVGAIRYGDSNKPYLALCCYHGQQTGC